MADATKFRVCFRVLYRESRHEGQYFSSVEDERVHKGDVVVPPGADVLEACYEWINRTLDRFDEEDEDKTFRGCPYSMAVYDEGGVRVYDAPVVTLERYRDSLGPILEELEPDSWEIARISDSNDEGSGMVAFWEGWGDIQGYQDDVYPEEQDDLDGPSSKRFFSALHHIIYDQVINILGDAGMKGEALDEAADKALKELGDCYEEFVLPTPKFDEEPD